MTTEWSHEEYEKEYRRKEGEDEITEKIMERKKGR
jgi:hypothetical protein